MEGASIKKTPAHVGRAGVRVSLGAAVGRVSAPRRKAIIPTVPDTSTELPLPLR
jgi:hypothetical protein